MVQIKGTFDTVAPHLHLEPECLVGLTWLQRGQADSLAGCQKRNRNILYLSSYYNHYNSGILFNVKLQTVQDSYLGSFYFTIHI